MLGFRFSKQKTNAALIGIGSGFALFLAFNWFTDGQHLSNPVSLCAAAGTALIAGIGLARLFVSMVDDKALPTPKPSDPVPNVESCQEAVSQSLLNFLKVIDVPLETGVRATIWAKGRESDRLYMLTDYLPSNSPSAFSSHVQYLHTSKGVVGCAFRTTSLTTDLIEDPMGREEYRVYLMRRWGFTREDVKYIDPEQRGFVAVPIPDSNSKLRPPECIAVIYIDSTEPSVVRGLNTKDNIDKACKAATLLEHPVKMLINLRGNQSS